ncbi:MAG: hypothetical protein AAFS10_25110, partial [Myxococcota bacterium]
HHNAQVLAETQTERTHMTLHDQGMSPRLRSDPPPQPCPWVVFAVPPSSSEDYAEEARRTVSLWDRRSDGEGALVMTSSTGVYLHSDGEPCVESSPVADHARARRILDAEAVILDAGGCVVRLAGLYNQDRGPHRVYMRNTTSERRPDGFINLIHYQDAAQLVVATLEHGTSAAIYMGCDDHPTTRTQLVDEALASPRYQTLEGVQRCTFTGTSGPLGRICDSSITRRALEWSPRWATFSAWAQTEG